MNGYTLTLWALSAALGAQALVAGLGIGCCLLPDQPPARRWAWMALTVGSLLLALHHAYTLQLTLHTGLHDPRQALLAAFAGACFALATFAFRRPA